MLNISSVKTQFDKTIDHLKSELGSIRTGRAHPSLVENMVVEYYGSKTPLIQLASINTPDSHSITIQPWDKNSLAAIEKSIRNSDLDLNPVNEGEIIRIPIPPLTEERRKELIKIVGKKIEEAKVGIRNTREDTWRSIKEEKNQGTISEDEMYKNQKELQSVVDEYNDTIQQIGDKKEKDIITV